MKLYSKSDLKDSRIFFDKRPPIFLSIFISFTLVLILLLSYFSTMLIKPYFVKAQGSVITSDNQFISSQLDGEVVSINVEEGQKVSKGDVLFTISNGQEGLNQSALTAQVKDLTEKLEIMDRYEKSLNQKVNKMKNTGIEQEYYGKVEYYLLQIKTDKFEENNLDDQINKKRQKKEVLDNEFNSLINKLKSIEDIEENKITRSEIQGSIDIKKDEIDSMKEEIGQFETQKSNPSSQSKQAYSQLTSELGSARSSINSKLLELEGQISIYSEQEASLIIKSKKSGIVHYLIPFKRGMTIKAGEVVAEVSNISDDELQVEAFIDAKDISMVAVGDQVKVAIQGVNIQKYGTVEGQILSIDSGTLTQETSNGTIVFYKSVIRLTDQKLTARNGHVVKVIKSMPVEARIIYDKETYNDWILKMLNFKTL